jgi:seryl-tRNA synthetase
MMYNRLTLVDNVSHKEALIRIRNDHRNLEGFSARNIHRYLPSNNPYIPRRVVTPRHNNSLTETKQAEKFSPTKYKETLHTASDNIDQKENDTAKIPSHINNDVSSYMEQKLKNENQQLKDKIVDLECKLDEAAEKENALNNALVQASFRTANQVPPTESREIVLNLEKFGAQLFIHIRNKKKVCYFQVDQSGKVVGLKMISEESELAKDLNG